MVPVAGSAYTYSYAVMGELVAWLVGWALILEYAVSASAVAVGWSGYIVGLLEHSLGIVIPISLSAGPYAGGLINLPAVLISLAVTVLLIIGTKESATVNAVMVTLKIVALLAFVALAAPALNDANFHPFMPAGTPGIAGAAASIFFAYVGFDAVSTAAEETRDPQRTVPLALFASLIICTVLYLLVAAAAAGAYGSQPLFGESGVPLTPGSAAMGARCVDLAALGQTPLVCSSEALAHVLRQIGHVRMGNLLALVAGFALPTVILTMIYGQTRIFFVMSRDGLLPKGLSNIHARFRTPHIVTAITGTVVAIAAAFLPVGQLADISNSGTLFAFAIVALAVMMLRKRDPLRARPFRTPFVWIIAPIAIAGCLTLFLFLPPAAKLVFPIWSAIGLTVYFAYGFRHSEMAPSPTIGPDLSAEVVASRREP
jgi:APA family basic amino acid/polyamine antiporter